jgi:hypothetical protein
MEIGVAAFAATEMVNAARTSQRNRFCMRASYEISLSNAAARILLWT